MLDSGYWDTRYQAIWSAATGDDLTRTRVPEILQIPKRSLPSDFDLIRLRNRKWLAKLAPLAGWVGLFDWTINVSSKCTRFLGGAVVGSCLFLLPKIVARSYWITNTSSRSLQFHFRAMRNPKPIIIELPPGVPWLMGPPHDGAIWKQNNAQKLMANFCFCLLLISGMAPRNVGLLMAGCFGWLGKLAWVFGAVFTSDWNSNGVVFRCTWHSRDK